MRNRGPGQWKEWRWGNTTIPLYLADPKEPTPQEQRPLCEVAHMCINQMVAKNSLPKLTDSISELQKEGFVSDADTGRVTEQRFRDVLKDALMTVCTPEEVEVVFPLPPPEGGSKRMSSKAPRAGTKQRQPSTTPPPEFKG
mmetsp:Transcript_66932/g.174133  ORF Transcript_66932/g.174133 Transcript_66932/m.174133 type:complete len:141 (+) Transcript_66932:105-527(+)